MDNIKNDSYYVNKIVADLSFVLAHTKDMSSEDFGNNEVLLDSVMFDLPELMRDIEKIV